MAVLGKKVKNKTTKSKKTKPGSVLASAKKSPPPPSPSKPLAVDDTDAEEWDFCWDAKDAPPVDPAILSWIDTPYTPEHVKPGYCRPTILGQEPEEDGWPPETEYQSSYKWPSDSAGLTVKDAFEALKSASPKKKAPRKEKVIDTSEQEKKRQAEEEVAPAAAPPAPAVASPAKPAPSPKAAAAVEAVPTSATSTFDPFSIKLTKNLMRELGGFSKPPEMIKQIVACFYILVEGWKKKGMPDWKVCKALCKDTKWERKFKANVVGNTTKKNIAKIKKAIKGMTKEDANNKSLACSTILEYLMEVSSD